MALRAALAAVASYLPEGRLTNEMLVEEFPDWTAEKIESKTGIRSRHVAAADEFTSDLAVKAAERLFAQPAVDRDEVDFIIMVTASPDYILPFTAGAVQAALGLPTSVGGIDIGLACSGYTYALAVAAGLVESGRARNVLLLTGDRYSAFTDEALPGSKTLFGDAATASLVSAVDSDGGGAHGLGLIGATRYGTDGSGGKNLVIPTSGLKGFVGSETTNASKPTLEMDGAQVFDFSLRVVPGFLRQFLADNQLGIEDIDLFVFHQANLFMLNHLRRRLRIPEERFAIHIADVGNTISSTIPLVLEHAREEGRIDPGKRALLLGFGAGYSWSVALLEP
jgi:3-oxoacyl-[acyl-carrier-protein] synthase-3